MKINAKQLLADYAIAAEALNVEVKTKREELEERLQPYIESGVLSVDDIEVLALKLTAKLSDEFNAKWETVDAEPYIVDEPKEPEQTDEQVEVEEQAIRT